MFGYTLRQPVVYSATSEGYVVVGTATSPGELLTNMNLQRQLAANYSSLISDRRLAERVADELGLDSSPEAIASQLSATTVGDTNQISVTASAGTPTEARDLANAAVKALDEVVHELENSALPDGAADVNLVRVEPSDKALLPT